MPEVTVFLAIVSVVNLALLGWVAFGARRNLRKLNWQVRKLRSEGQGTAGKVKRAREELKALGAHSRHTSKLVTKVNERIKDNHEALRDGQRELALLEGMSGLRFPHPFFLTGWTIDGFLAHRLLEILEERQPKTILELGSGASTVLVATMLDRLGAGPATHIAVDHLPEYLERTERGLKLQGTKHQPRLLLCPLASATPEAIPWYSGLAEHLANLKIDLVLVDGPPGGDHPMSRFPALDVLRPFLAPGATVFLDDVKRPAEAEIVSKWSAAYPELSVRLSDRGKGYAELTVPADVP